MKKEGFLEINRKKNGQFSFNQSKFNEALKTTTTTTPMMTTMATKTTTTTSATIITTATTKPMTTGTMTKKTSNDDPHGDKDNNDNVSNNNNDGNDKADDDGNDDGNDDDNDDDGDKDNHDNGNDDGHKHSKAKRREANLFSIHLTQPRVEKLTLASKPFSHSWWRSLRKEKAPAFCSPINAALDLSILRSSSFHIVLLQYVLL